MTFVYSLNLKELLNKEALFASNEYITDAVANKLEINDVSIDLACICGIVYFDCSRMSHLTFACIKLIMLRF